MGLVNFDTSLLAQLVVNSQTVTLTQRASETTDGSAFQVQYAQRRAPTKQQKEMLPQVEVVWHVWAAYLFGYTPKVRDRITDQGTNEVWQVERVEIQSWGRRFRLLCFKENF